MPKIFLSLLLTLTILFSLSASNVKAQAAPNTASISNIGATYFTVSWYTDQSVPSNISIGFSAASLTTKGKDDRGGGFTGRTHHVTFYQLKADTEYFFQIEGGAVQSQKTASSLYSTRPPEWMQFQGDVVTIDKEFPKEAIVYLRLENSQILSTTVGQNGGWIIKTFLMRDSSLSNFITIKEEDPVYILARSGAQGIIFTGIHGSQRDKKLRLNLADPRIPIQRLQLFDENDQSTLSATPTTPQNTSSAPENLNFFQKLWESILGIVNNLF